MKSKPTYKTKMSQKSEEYTPSRETIDTNKYILTFNTHKIPKEIKIGY